MYQFRVSIFSCKKWWILCNRRPAYITGSISKQIGINSSREYKYKNDGNNFPTDGEETFTALEVLENYKKNKKIVTPYLRENEILYLNNNIDDIQIYYTGNCEREWGNKYVIAFIKKK